ncbi:hypothetical protein V8J39_19990 [Frigidibacter sp. MR17.24]
MAGATLAIGTLAGVLWFWTGPRVTEWAQEQLGTADVSATLAAVQATQTQQANTQEQQATVLRQQQDTLATIGNTLSQTAETLKGVVDRIASLEKSQREDRVPPIKIVDDSLRVTSGQIGDFVRFEFLFTKSRDCGRPQSVAYFVDPDGFNHAFVDKSTDAADGRSVSANITSTPIAARFMARIPINQGIAPTGPDRFARAYLLLSWPDCPNVPPLRSPTAPFQIFPPG